MSEALYNSADFIELLLKTIIRSSAVLDRAKSAKLDPKDLGMVNIYQELLKIALDVGQAPIAQDLLLLLIKNKINTGALAREQLDEIAEFVEFIYSGDDINEQYMLGHVIPFVEQRRFAQIAEASNTAQEIVEQSTKLVYELRNVSTGTTPDSMNPFDTPVFTVGKVAMGLGLPTVDQCAYGLAFGEYGLIIGYSGTGKTALGTFSLARRALEGTKVQYLSLEEPGANICNRVYSNLLRINYTDLHLGRAAAGVVLEAALSDMDQSIRQALRANLRIKCLRDEAPMTTQAILNFLNEQYKETGFRPDLLYVDQMEYIAPSVTSPNLWQNFQQASMDCHMLAKSKIGEEHPFALWVLHQATGPMRRTFTNGEISGFKGIIKPADMVIGIGKDAPSDTIVNIFSLKVRHCPNFAFDYLTDLSHMSFEPYDRASDQRQLLANQEDTNRAKKLAQRPKRQGQAGQDLFNNIPGRPRKLPAADGWRTE